MKRKSFYFLVVLVLLVFATCDKEKADPGNYFSYAGKNYTINETELLEYVFNSGTPNEYSMNQFVFTNISGTDTTDLLIAAYDTLSNVLSGTYNSLDQLESENTSRGIMPFGLLFISGLSMSNGNFFLTGKGGSFVVSVKDGNYSIDFTNISLGIYSDLFDEDQNGNAGYTETGKLGGLYNGTISKYTQPLSKKSNRTNRLFEKLMQEKISQIRK